MKDLRLIIPVTPNNLVSEQHSRIANTLGSTPEWLVSWTLQHWQHCEQQYDLDMYDKLFDDLHSALEANGMPDDQYIRYNALLEEHVPDVAVAVNEIVDKLEPFLGTLATKHPNARIYGMDYDLFGKDAMVISISAEAEQPCNAAFG